MSTEGTAEGTTQWPPTMPGEVKPGDIGRLLEHLSRNYEPPIRRWFQRKVRRWGLDEAEAGELTQGFFALVAGGRDIGVDLLGNMRFRRWLQTCLGNYFTDQMRRRQRRPEDSMAELPEPPPESAAEGEGLDLELAARLHEQIMGLLRQRWTESGRAERFALLEGYLPFSDEAHPADAGPFGNANNRRQALSRLRDEYMEEFEERTRELAAAGDLEDERRYLLGCILRSREGGAA